MWGLSIGNFSYETRVFSVLSTIQEMTWPVKKLGGYIIAIIAARERVRKEEGDKGRGALSAGAPASHAGRRILGAAMLVCRERVMMPLPCGSHIG